MSKHILQFIEATVLELFGQPGEGGGIDIQAAGQIGYGEHRRLAWTIHQFRQGLESTGPQRYRRVTRVNLVDQVTEFLQRSRWQVVMHVG